MFFSHRVRYWVVPVLAVPGTPTLTAGFEFGFARALWMLRLVNRVLAGAAVRSVGW